MRSAPAFTTAWKKSRSSSSGFGIITCGDVTAPPGLGALTGVPPRCALRCGIRAWGGPARSCRPPREDCDAAVAEITVAGHEPELAARDLRGSCVVAQLARGFDDVV